MWVQNRYSLNVGLCHPFVPFCFEISRIQGKLSFVAFLERSRYFIPLYIQYHEWTDSFLLDTCDNVKVGENKTSFETAFGSHINNTLSPVLKFCFSGVSAGNLRIYFLLSQMEALRRAQSVRTFEEKTWVTAAENLRSKMIQENKTVLLKDAVYLFPMH